MPTAENPFEDVLSEKEWSKARDKTGLTSGLTEKVNMGKEFTVFHQKNDMQGALHLLEKLGIYEQVLKNKHSKDRYYAKLLKLLQDQKQAVQTGIQIIENVPKIDEVRKRLKKIGDSNTSLEKKARDMSGTKVSEERFLRDLRAITRRARELKETIPEGTIVLPGDVVAKVVEIERDLKQTLEELEAEANEEYDDDQGVGARAGRDDIEMHWDRFMAPYITAGLNKLLSPFGDRLELAVSPEQLIEGLLRPVREKHRREYDRGVVKTLRKSGKPEDPLTEGWCEQIETLIGNEIRKVCPDKDQPDLDGQGESQWFRLGATRTQKKGGKKKDVGMNPNPGVDPQTGKDVPGVRPEGTDDSKNFGALLMKLAPLKGDIKGSVKLLVDEDRMQHLFPNSKTTVATLLQIGGHVSNAGGRIEGNLRSDPPNLDGARTELANLRQTVTQLCHGLPQHGDVVENGLRQFVLKTLEDRITGGPGE